jgi:nitrogen fixation NifU-like protein
MIDLPPAGNLDAWQRRNFDSMPTRLIGVRMAAAAVPLRELYAETIGVAHSRTANVVPMLRLAAQPMPDTRFYDELIMDHIKNARNYRAVPDASHAAAGSNPLCGDEMRVFLRIERDRIADVGFQCACCGISMASASIMSAMLIGTHQDEAEHLLLDFKAFVERAAPASQPISAEWRALRDTLSRFPARLRCAALPWTTLEQALHSPQHPEREQI